MPARRVRASPLLRYASSDIVGGPAACHAVESTGGRSTATGGVGDVFIDPAEAAGTDDSSAGTPSNPAVDVEGLGHVEPLEVIVINGPVLHEMARSIAREREREAGAVYRDRRVVRQRNGARMAARVARAWGVLRHPAITITRGRRRHHVLLQHEEYEGW